MDRCGRGTRHRGAVLPKRRRCPARCRRPDATKCERHARIRSHLRNSSALNTAVFSDAYDVTHRRVCANHSMALRNDGDNHRLVRGLNAGEWTYRRECRSGSVGYPPSARKRRPVSSAAGLFPGGPSGAIPCHTAQHCRRKNPIISTGALGSSPPFRIFSASAGEAQAQARHRFSEINSPRLCLASPSGASTGRRRPPAARHRNGARPRVSFHRIDQS